MVGGFGGIVTAELRGTLDDARRMLERCELFSLAESLGGVESLIEHPGLMTHASLPPAMRASLGISDGLIRLSVGIEAVDDLIADLRQALSKSGGGRRWLGAANAEPVEADEADRLYCNPAWLVTYTAKVPSQ